MHCSRRLIVQTLVFSRSYLRRQVSLPETLVVKGGTTLARNGRWILPENARLPRNIQGSFTCHKSTTWDKRLYSPSEGRRAEDFFALKNPTASAGFEPANLDTKGQHATSRPPKPLMWTVFIWFRWEVCVGRCQHSTGLYALEHFLADRPVVQLKDSGPFPYLIQASLCTLTQIKARA